MSTDPRPGMIRFSGAVAVYPVAICRQCDAVFPFDSDERRISWAVEHQRAGHRIEFAVDVRPDPTKPSPFITQQHQSTPSWQAFMRARNPLSTQEADNQKVSMKSDEPKRLNARDRRRLRRKDKQRNDDAS
jgi:hypothetical protein